MLPAAAAFGQFAVVVAAAVAAASEKQEKPGC